MKRLLGLDLSIEYKDKSENLLSKNKIPSKVIVKSSPNAKVEIKNYFYDPNYLKDVSPAKLLDKNTIIANSEIVDIEQNFMDLDIDTYYLLREFDFLKSEYRSALRLAFLSQKFHKERKYKKSIKIIKDLRERYGEKGNTINNLYLSSHLKLFVLAELHRIKHETNFNVEKIKKEFGNKFEEILEDYPNAIYVGTIKSVNEVIKDINNRYNRDLRSVSLFSRERYNNAKSVQALEEYTKNPNNPTIRIEEFENPFYEIKDALNFKIYFRQTKSEKLKREKELKKKKRKKMKRKKKKK